MDMRTMSMTSQNNYHKTKGDVIERMLEPEPSDAEINEHRKKKGSFLNREALADPNLVSTASHTT